MRIFRGIFSFALMLSVAWAVPPFTAEEIARQPAANRINALIEEAATQGWGQVVPPLLEAALAAYEGGSGYAANWYYLYRWADLLGTPRSRALEDWIKAVEAAGVAHANMPSRFEVPPGSLGSIVNAEWQRVALNDAAFSEEFFSIFAPVDDAQAVLKILQDLYAKEPALFSEYRSLAIAIAVVYDVPPPPYWPHGQVAGALLPRALPAPEVAFRYWAKLDRSNLTTQRLRRLPASELKFVVDAITPLPELDWARANVATGLAEFAKTYDLIKYRQDRLVKNQLHWPGADYRLATILTQGGICVDQAYFASAVGKAKGIPTIMFRGAGLDGRHAWFGFLDASQRWQLDAGRYAEQKFVVGLAFDPQTWGNINDHELLFIAERFRALPTYCLSMLHTLFAREYLRAHRPDAALKAAREAVNRERRNLAAWQALLETQRAAAPEDLRGREAMLREAMQAFQKYADVERSFSQQLGEVLRSRGETSLATHEAQRLAQKYQSARGDLSIQQAADTIARSIQTEDLATQIRTFYRVLESTGRGAAIDYYDKVVAPFVLHLAKAGQIPAARQALAKARQVLRVESGKQLETEITLLDARLRAGKLE